MPDTMFIRLTEALNNMVAIITSINDGQCIKCMGESGGKEA